MFNMKQLMNSYESIVNNMFLSSNVNEGKQKIRQTAESIGSIGYLHGIRKSKEFGGEK